MCAIGGSKLNEKIQKRKRAMKSQTARRRTRIEIRKEVTARIAMRKYGHENGCNMG